MRVDLAEGLPADDLEGRQGARRAAVADPRTHPDADGADHELRNAERLLRRTRRVRRVQARLVVRRQRHRLAQIVVGRKVRSRELGAEPARAVGVRRVLRREERVPVGARELQDERDLAPRGIAGTVEVDLLTRVVAGQVGLDGQRGARERRHCQHRGQEEAARAGGECDAGACVHRCEAPADGVGGQS